MKGFNNNTYWIAVAHIPKWNIERINRLIIQVVHENQITWADFFGMDRKGWQELFAFTEKELIDLDFVKSDLPRLAFIAEQLQNEGFQLIPINSPDYPISLKENLKVKSAPPVLYIRGRKTLLQEDAVAIVGSRKAGPGALKFTDRIARQQVAEQKVIVSGFAKGVDKQALDSALEAGGKSIIVLPQGILTFQSGFKKYYEPIVNGDVLVLSTFFPKAGWEVGLAMARNIYIYGLAKEIFVAESDNKGGTWEGVIDGLKRNRSIYVRYPELGEKNANLRLIEMGAIPIHAEESEKAAPVSKTPVLIDTLPVPITQEPQVNFKADRDIVNEILSLLNKGVFSSKEILLALTLDWDSRKMTTFLRKLKNVKVIEGRPLRFTLEKECMQSLF